MDLKEQGGRRLQTDDRYRGEQGGQWAWTLPGAPASVPVGRRLVCEALAWPDPSIPALLTSELLTNAVVHGQDPVTLELTTDGVTARITVGDGSSVPPLRRRAQPLDIGGHGLNLVQQLSTRWGWSRDDNGKRIWFDTRRSDELPGR